MRGLAEHFDQWMHDELGRLNAARIRVRIHGYTAETADSLYACVQELKGLAATYGYGVVSLIAESLCQLMNDPISRRPVPLSLVDSHIGCIKAAVHGDIRQIDDSGAKTLLAELQRCIAECDRTEVEAERFRLRIARSRS
jgi:hypothetical protein